MRRTVIAAAAAAAALALTPAAATAATRTPPPPSGQFIIDNYGTGYPLNLPAVGSQVQTAGAGYAYGIHYLGTVRSLEPFSNLLYDGEYASDGVYQLQASGGAHCLGNSGRAVILDGACNGASYQQWVRTGDYWVNVTATDNFGDGLHGVVMTASGTGTGRTESDQVALTGSYENQWVG